jgi:hypothetical protein
VKHDRAVILKTDVKYAWIAVLDPASGKRGRYTVYRIDSWANKGTKIIGREVDLVTARKLAGTRPGKGADFDWRKATLMLAKCVIATVQTGGKIGMGSGMVMSVVDGKKTIERWDKDFVEALAFIGIEMVDKKPKGPKKRARE